MSGFDDKPPFKVTDRRAEPGEPEPAHERDADDARAEDEAAAGPADTSVDFVSFVVGLATSALAHLGDKPAPDEPPPDLALARQTIDILGMLEQKTKGNLTGDEERILSHLLYDLRIRYVERVRQRG